MANQENPFEGFEVISEYTDQNATEDGVLIKLGQRNRITRAAFIFLTKFVNIANAESPTNWPVEMMGWFKASGITVKKTKSSAKLSVNLEVLTAEGRAKLEQAIRDKRAVALAVGLIGKYERQARIQYDQNTGGGIFKIAPIITNGVFTKLGEPGVDAAAPVEEPFWLLPNEVGGMTLMFPSDY